MQLPVSLPGGYRTATGHGAWGFASSGALLWLADVLTSGASIHSWAGTHPERRELAGRGRTWAVPAPAHGPGGAHGWVVRHYRRGGAVARWLHDRYLATGTPRPVAELRSSLEASRRGIPTPAVVAGALYPAGAFYRADLVTEEIAGGVDLAEILFADRTKAMDPLLALAAAGALVRRLAETGVRHADLNARNVVLEPRTDGPRAWLVDLDRCRFTAGADRQAGVAMRSRLERSLRKLGSRARRPLGGDAWAALDAGFRSVGGCA
jgi:3-deoxy-D-manno-octulosonic acid kinase